MKFQDQEDLGEPPKKNLKKFERWIFFSNSVLNLKKLVAIFLTSTERGHSCQDGEVKLQGVDDWTPGPMKPYEDLLERLYKIIEEHNPTVGHILSVSKDFSFVE